MTTTLHRAKGLIGRLDFDLETVFRLVTRLCQEAHMDDDEIAEVIREGSSESLEIVSDTADEVLAKVQTLIVEARLAITEFRAGVRP